MENALLKTSGLTKKFGELVAVNNVNYEIKSGDTNGIIGPNGAGKSTFFNLITGLHTPTAGSVTYKEEDITKLPSYKRTSKGLIRTFQLVSVFESLPVIENLILSCVRFSKFHESKSRFFFTNKKSAGIKEKCTQELERVNLASKKNIPTNELSYGDKRKLEIAMALSLQPTILFLDEPFAGLSEEEIEEISDLLNQLKKTMTLLMIEHKVSRLTDIVERLTVMHRGEFIVDGDPEKVINDRKVREVYWGEEE